MKETRSVIIVNPIILFLLVGIGLMRLACPLSPSLILDKITFDLPINLLGQLRKLMGRFSPNSPLGFSGPIPAYRAERKKILDRA